MHEWSNLSNLVEYLNVEYSDIKQGVIAAIHHFKSLPITNMNDYLDIHNSLVFTKEKKFQNISLKNILGLLFML